MQKITVYFQWRQTSAKSSVQPICNQNHPRGPCGFRRLRLTTNFSARDTGRMDHSIRVTVTTTRRRGRPQGALSTPRRHDLEVLWWIYDLQESGTRFAKALDMLRDFAFTPGISILPDDDRHGILRDTDESTDRKRLRRLARRFPGKCDLLRALPSQLSITGVLLAPAEGCLLSATTSALPAAALGSGSPN